MVLTIHESFDNYPKWLVTYCWALLWRFVCSTQEYPLLCCCHLGCNIHKWAFLDISLPCPHRIFWTNFTCVQVSGLHSAWSFTAKPLSSMQNCLKPGRFSIGHGDQVMVYRRCSYFQTPSSCVSGAVRITSTSWGSLPNDSIIKQFYNYLQPLFLHLRMVCCIYCWTARVESISSKGSSTHWEKLAVFVPDLFDLTLTNFENWLAPGRFRLMITVPEVDPSPIFVIITVIYPESPQTSLKRRLL